MMDKLKANLLEIFKDLLIAIVGSFIVYYIVSKRILTLKSLDILIDILIGIVMASIVYYILSRRIINKLKTGLISLKLMHKLKTVIKYIFLPFKIIKNTRLLIKNKIISFNKYVYHITSRIKLRHFERLTKKSFPVDNDISFYKGFAPTKAEIGSNRDVIRELHHQLFPQILETKDIQSNSYLSIIGKPGEGKSTLLLRFAKELVENKEIVLWADATYKFANENPFDELKLIRKREMGRLFAIIDNIARLSRYREFLQDLARHPDVKVTLIGASRVEDWEKVKFEHPPGIEYLFENPDSKPLLPYKLTITKDDIKAAVKKLQEKAVLKEIKRPLREPENFSILIWSLAAPRLKENFRSIVLKETDELSAEENKVYCYICALHRLGLPMPASLIKRLLGEDDIGCLEGLVKRGIIRYIAKIDSYISRHEVVAETIFRDFCPQIAACPPCDFYKNMLQKSTLKEEKLVILLFQRLERDLTVRLKDDLIEKYKKTFSKSRSAELLGKGWGPILYELSLYDLAERAFLISLAINDKLPEAHNNYALFLYETARYSEAEVHFRRTLELKEDYHDAYYNYANLLFKLKRYPEAEELYKRSLELKKDDPKAHNNYANLLFKLKRYPEAEVHYRRALELKEDFPDAHFNYAILLVGLERSAEAKAHFKRVLELKDDYAEAMANLGFLYKDFFRQPQKAIFWLKKAWEHRDKLPDKGQMVKKALEALSSEKGDKKEGKSPESEL